MATRDVLQDSVDLLEREEDMLLDRVELETRRAKTALAENTPQAKELALQCLRRRKKLEQRLDALTPQLVSIKELQRATKDAELKAAWLRRQREQPASCGRVTCLCACAMTIILLAVRAR
eukprot:TRINITY_DN3143_c0_g1_i1.p1 TRINITY_DN3143_c0_g1~~TRINITY_DN3143_c0_g1_i1.p1  ORF type:complete len:120 (+),score=16.64 TRINITY_DN3143_c0_g1_i1:59-418(+)